MLKVKLNHRLGDFRLDAEFEADGNSITGLFGKSGAGKSSLINMVAGLVSPDCGYISIGKDVLFDAKKGINLPAEKRRIGYIFQDSRLFPHMNVRANLTYGMTGSSSGGGSSNEEMSFDRVVDLLGIASLLDRRPKNLSGGEKQRIAIGRALLSNPRLLLMDEPLASIDVQRRNEILPFIERLRDEIGMMVIYVSHAIEEVIHLADKMVLLSNGRIAATGGVEEIMSRLDLHPLTGRFDTGAVLSTTFSRYDDVFDIGELAFGGGTFRVTGVNLPAGTPLRAHVRARDVSLMLARPEGTSILNVFEGAITEIRDDGGSQIDILMDIGAPLIARITRKSFTDLELSEDKTVFALIKAVAIDRRSLGGQPISGAR